MTKIKKMLGVMMAALMCFALTPAMAFGETGTNDDSGKITIDKAIEGQDYSVYQILELESFSTSPEAYSYKATAEWNSWLQEQTAYVAFDAQGYVTWVENASVADFAAAAIAHAKEASIPATATQKATGTTVEFTGLNLGYYLVDSSAGALCALNTTAKEITITEKNDQPTVDKTVQENSKSVYGETNDANIGDIVKFQATITAQPGAVNYVFRDTMSAGLTFDPASVVVTKAGATLEAGTDYTLTTEGLSAGRTFEIAFSDAVCAAITNKNETITINYAAELNEDAVVGDAGNKNSAQLVYGENNDIETTPSETITYTWELPIFKYTGALEADGTHGANTTALAGAVFELTKEGSTEVIATVTTDADGNAAISGLDSGTYHLTETQAPNGYNKIAGAQTIIIANDGTITVNGSATSEVAVLNQSGSLLPSTGGIGTTIFYIVGGVLVIGAIVFFVRRRSKATK